MTMTTSLYVNAELRRRWGLGKQARNPGFHGACFSSPHDRKSHHAEPAKVLLISYLDYYVYVVDLV